MWQRLARRGACALAWAAVTLTAHAQGTSFVVGQLIERGADQADYARDFMAGAKVAFDAANQSGGIKGRRISLVRREAALNEAIPQAVDMIERDHVELLFGVSERLLPVLAASPEIARRNVPLLAPLSGATSTADNVLFIRPDYDHEIVAAHNRLRQFGMRRIALVTAAGFDPQLGVRLRGSIAKGNAAETLDLYTLTGDPAELAARIAPTKPTAVIVAGDTLTYATVGRALAQQGWYGFLVGLSSVNPQVAREILGSGYSGGMLLAQTVPNPASGVTKVAREHMARMKQFLDEPPSAATLSGYIAAVYLVQAMNAAGGKVTGVELRRALQTRVDVGGFTLDFTRGNRGSEFVDLNYIQGAGN
ncbi:MULTISPECIES: ABC transporter substrate-binding protein [Ralstonia]|jgi:ABC-type branched-subunit amino acid transport system substrate-binding protein|uniref:ABC transporter substrate-binding protein n=4 Tax=Pseudomonadota TaxID=1224 RepID=A0A2P4RFU9_RALPI|nr:MULTISPECIES: ABC transporter substrate-binding protein [Ralstonia]MBA4203088.1 high-affinity branched-chain amino acid ABC transporter substrate-binding protein [Ralstonia sp.]MBA4233709.1 high-affinity branched-chain amino acid ABC transporter substrate-binding protein [Ralstonia sp.]MBA4238956.1 high-affinity branched-chain amino acid ABC transporter substrate-binding protein [Ralstonia sp.]MBA4279245.1 high-affinity branched-chain amino acid ABC transporter substrate-binding protein [Ral